MVDEEIVMDTIRKMKESGLEDSIILSTLQDIGLSEEQANQFIARISSGASPTQASPTPLSPSPQPLQQSQLQSVPPSQQPQLQSVPSQQPVPPSTALKQGAPLPGYAQQPAQITQPFPATTAQQPLQQQPQVIGVTPVKPQQALPPQSQVQVQQPAQPFLSQQAVQAAQPQSQIPPELKVHLAERSEEDAMRHAQTQAMLAEQARSISEMHKTVQKAAKKIEKIKPISLPPGTSAGIKALALQIDSLRRDIEETKAMASATKTLLEKILEVNRKILGRLP